MLLPVWDGGTMAWTKRKQLSAQRISQNKIRRTPRGRAYTLFDSIKQRTKRSGVEFDLTTEWIENYILKGRCQVTGIKFDLKPSIDGKHSNPFAPSIDKINPKRGYVKKNCQVVLHAVNQAKGEMSMREYKKITERIWEGMNQ